MPKLTRAEAFDEWMRAYIEDPGGFEAEFQTVGLFLQEQADGKPPTYGQICAAYLEMLEEGEPPTMGTHVPAIAPPTGPAEEL